MKNTDFSFSLI